MNSSLIPSNVIKSLIQFYVRKQRAKEEISIVEQEMRETISYWDGELQVIANSVSNQTSFGFKCILQERAIIIQNFLVEQLKRCFQFAITSESEGLETVESGSLNDNIQKNDHEEFLSDEEVSSDEELSSNEEGSSISSDENGAENSEFSDDIYIWNYLIARTDFCYKFLRNCKRVFSIKLKKFNKFC